MIKNLIKALPIIAIITMAGCYSAPKLTAEGDADSLKGEVDNFYTMLIGREVGNRHNDQDEKFRKFFLDKTSYYDFLDSYIPLVRDRNLIYNSFHHYYIIDVKVAEDGQTGEIKLRLLSRDAPFLYRKLELTHTWNKQLDKWYPGKVNAPMLTKWNRPFKLFAIPPRPNK